jgi:folylpolyglutamate synthase/dihydropteroate synthase
VEYSNVRTCIEGTFFEYMDLKWEKTPVCVSLLGEYQAENCALALKALEFFLVREKKYLHIPTIKKCLCSLSWFWRFERFDIDGKIVILDGAHNEQKVSSFLSSLSKIYFDVSFSFLIALKEWRNPSLLDEVLLLSSSIYSSLITTDFDITQDFCMRSVWKIVYQNYFENNDFLFWKHISDPKKALDELLHQKNNNIIVVTGSLYLLSCLYPYVLHKQKNNGWEHYNYSKNEEK